MVAAERGERSSCPKGPVENAWKPERLAFAAASADGSAGARMAAWLGSRGTGAFGEKSCLRPAAVVMQYTGLSEVTGDEPPTYSCVGTDDKIASYRTMQERRSRCSTVFPTASGWARGPSRRAGSIVRQLSGRDGCVEDFGGGRVNRWGTRRAEGANAEEHRACLEPSPASSSARSGAYSHPPV